MRSWGAALGGWWCLRPAQPTAGSVPTQRSARSHFAPQLMRQNTSREKKDVVLRCTFRAHGRETTCEEVFLPRLERVLDRSIMALLLGLFRTDLLAKDISAVTRVIEMLKNHLQIWKDVIQNVHSGPALQLQFSEGRNKFLLPAVKSVLEEVKERFLHHVCYLHRSAHYNHSVSIAWFHTLTRLGRQISKIFVLILQLEWHVTSLTTAH